MSNNNSNGEVYGSKLFTLAAVAVSAAVLAGTIYSPAQTTTSRQIRPVVEHVVVKAPAANPVSG